MRTLLLVQSGDAQPKFGGCVPPVTSLRGLPAMKGWASGRAFGYWGADRWWIVECETARHGREVIASGRTELRSGFGGDGSILIGRIIASGGRS